MGKECEVVMYMYMSLFNCFHMLVFMWDSGSIYDLFRSSATIVLLSRALNHRLPQGFIAIIVPICLRCMKRIR